MNTHNITISDNDILEMNDNTGDITIDHAHLPESCGIGDDVIIHYVEDDDNVFHRYTVEDSTLSVVTLRWNEQLDESVLTEANIFDKAARRTGKIDKAADAGKKASDKQAKKIDNKLLKLMLRDLKEGQKNNWSIYLQKPSKKYSVKPHSFKEPEIKELYKMQSPCVLNALVTETTDSGGQWLVRRAAEDCLNHGVPYDKNLNPNTINLKYLSEWAEGDTNNILALTDKFTQELGINKTKKAAKKSDKKADKTSAETEEQAVETEEQAVKTDTNATQNTADAAVQGDNPEGQSTGGATNSNDKAAALAKFLKDNNIQADQVENLMSEIAKGNMSEELIVESPVLKLNDTDRINPASVDLRGKLRAAAEEERVAAEEQARVAAVEANKEKYAAVLEKFQHNLDQNHSTVDILESLFDDLVPAQGMSDTVGGEMVRAMMRILYRNYNDGDKFFEGYGIETCGSSAAYLMDNGLDELVTDILNDAHRLADNDESYEERLQDMARAVVETLANNRALIYTPNDVDSREYSSDYIEENEPTYEFSFTPSDEICQLLDKHVITAWDVNEYVDSQLEWSSVFKNATTTRPWSTYSYEVEVEGLTRDGLEALRDMVRDSDGFWEDLKQEHIDDLDSSDEEYDDDYESSDDEE